MRLVFFLEESVGFTNCICMALRIRKTEGGDMLADLHPPPELPRVLIAKKGVSERGELCCLRQAKIKLCVCVCVCTPDWDFRGSMYIRDTIIPCLGQASWRLFFSAPALLVTGVRFVVWAEADGGLSGIAACCLTYCIGPLRVSSVLFFLSAWLAWVPRFCPDDNCQREGKVPLFLQA